MYAVRRQFASASNFSVDIVKRGAQAPALSMTVQLYITNGGRVHAGSLRPSAVTFSEPTLSYDSKTRRLEGVREYQQRITQTYHLSAYDTNFVVVGAKDEIDLPCEISVVNNDGRVGVFRGAHTGAYTPASSTRTADLLAHVPTTDGQIPSDWSCDQIFELRLHPGLEKCASNQPGALALLLAIATEGFWSQGGICHGGLDPRDDTHAGAVDDIALLEHDLGRGNGSIVQPAKSLLRGIQRHYLKHEKRARSKREREKKFDSI